MAGSVSFYKIVLSTCLQLLLVAFSSFGRAQQTTNSRGVQVEFVRKRTTQLSNELSSNVLKIKNNAGRDVSFSVNISAPEGWSFISRKTNTYTVKSNDSLFIPVNLIPKNIRHGNVSHVINASLISESNIQFASSIWYMNIKKESKWSASVNQNKIFFLNNGTRAEFAVRLKNLGNSEEKIKIQFLSDKRLRVLDKADRPIEIKFANIILPLNADTVLFFNVEKLKPAQNNFREDFESANRSSQSDAIPLRIIVQNEASENSISKSWRGTIDFIKAGAESKLKEHGSASLPVTIEANVDNILDNSTILNLSLYGNADLSRERSLSYRFQTYFTDNFYNFSPFLGYSHYLGYFSPKTTLEAGEVTGSSNFGFSAAGRGIKVSQRFLENHTAGVFYIQSPSFFDEKTRSAYGINYRLSLNSSSVDNFLQFNENYISNTKGVQYSNRIRFSVSRFHNFTINTAISNETYNGATPPLSKSGYAYLLNYSGSFRRFNFSLGNSLGTKYNIGYRGIETLNGNVTYTLNNRSNLGASYYSYNQNPEFLTQTGSLITARKSASERYELKYNYNPPEYGLSLRLQHQYLDYFNLESEANGFGIDFRPTLTPDVRFYLSVLGEYTNLLNYQIDPYFSSQVRASFRYRGLSTNIRYFYGPYRMAEQILFASTRVNNQSIFSNTNLRLWLLKDKLTFEPSFTYSYETSFKRTRISLRPEVYYLPKSGLELRFYGQYINNAQRDNPLIDPLGMGNINSAFSSSNLFFGFGVKKQLAVPVSKKKYHKLSVAIFKDFNGNGSLDKNEQGLKNVLVNIRPVIIDSIQNSFSGLKETGEDFITDGNGRITYNNLPKGAYRIKIVPLSETSGFFAGNEQIVTVDKDIDLLMPMNQGVQLTGALVVDRDVVVADLEKKYDISKIRVTALDSAGKAYSTLTDKDGYFNLRLPVGIYQISINESALPDNFELEQKSIKIEMLSASDNYNITFLVTERKRKLNIKKFDKDGKLIENKD